MTSHEEPGMDGLKDEDDGVSVPLSDDSLLDMLDALV